ncbi:uncharacterized protein MCYG_08350 [Microsporum canis CBS 113480]|uniref:Uncharacterized protein n=1 Tax=Arthroderma otae (strain ATCC MYA-4605 / CBS 113480) TaxID=554155 RepID=C5G078_ARTOC|nr:uncharacterized protein MCYG_08350 [Microsporum canis CBS 113480]EEQ35531.1 predicted protein [Microsporum canis CBS 113480]
MQVKEEEKMVKLVAMRESNPTARSKSLMDLWRTKDQKITGKRSRLSVCIFTRCLFSSEDSEEESERGKKEEREKSLGGKEKIESDLLEMRWLDGYPFRRWMSMYPKVRGWANEAALFTRPGCRGNASSPPLAELPARQEPRGAR